MRDDTGRVRDQLGRVVDDDGLPIRWAYCLRCGGALSNTGSQMDGFGTTCYVKLHRGERRRLHDRAVESREVERGHGTPASSAWATGSGSPAHAAGALKRAFLQAIYITCIIERR